jgi:hypothetical protein
VKGKILETWKDIETGIAKKKGEALRLAEAAKGSISGNIIILTYLKNNISLLNKIT